MASALLGDGIYRGRIEGGMDGFDTLGCIIIMVGLGELGRQIQEIPNGHDGPGLGGTWMTRTMMTTTATSGGVGAA